MTQTTKQKTDKKREAVTLERETPETWDERMALSGGTRPLTYTPEQVVEAVKGSGGFVTEIARRLGCSRSTVYRFKKNFKEVAEAIYEEKENLLDSAESALLKQIGKGNITAIIFYLKTQGYHRAYGDRSKLDIDGNFITKEKREEDANKDAEYVKKVMKELDGLLGSTQPQTSSQLHEKGDNSSVG